MPVERVPFPVDTAFDVRDSRLDGLHRWANQAPIGCRFYDDGSTVQNISANTHTTLDFRNAASPGVVFDPYNLIDLTNNTVRIPQPGIYDIGWDVWVSNIVAASDSVFAQFSQGTSNVASNKELGDFMYAGAIGDFIHLHCYDTVYISPATLGAGDIYRMRGVCIGSAAEFKLTAFVLWLRSANLPSRY